MHRIKRFALLSLAVLLAAVFYHTALALAAPADRLTVSGAFLNAQSKPVKEVGIEVLVNGQAVYIARAAFPYFLMMLVAVLLIWFVPSLVTYLPSQMKL